MSRLRQLLRHDTAGDPMGRRGLWTGLHLEQISGQLKRLGLSVCPNTVRRLPEELGCALHVNRKSLSGPQSPERDHQFRHLQFQRQEFSREGLPVNDHDFRSQAKGMAIPRGLHDLQANRGSVLIGTSHYTPEFAADAIVAWWRDQGRRRYGPASELLILADSGGGNGARCRLWKCALQEKLADRFQLAVTVCHYPTGISKWNPIEHRLFSETSKHRAGQPLTDYSTIVRLIGETKTKTGLRVSCALTTKDYPAEIKVSDEQMRELDLLKHPIPPEWNYTLRRD